MGYNTDFWGSISITPPLNEHEINYLRHFAECDPEATTTGPYSVAPRDDGADADQASPAGISPAQDAPSSACQWIPSDDGTELEYDQQEKFYDSTIWMAYLIDTFLKTRGHRTARPGPPNPQLGLPRGTGAVHLRPRLQRRNRCPRRGLERPMAPRRTRQPRLHPARGDHLQVRDAVRLGTAHRR